MATNENEPIIAELRARQRALVERAGQPARSRDNSELAYAEKLVLARELVAALSAEIEYHARRQSSDWRNWGYVGDMGYVADQLGETLSSLAGLES